MIAAALLALMAAPGGVHADSRGIVLTQYSEPAAPRYGLPAAAPQYGVPPQAAPASAPFDPYIQVPPTAEPGGAWNGGAAANANPLRMAQNPASPAAAESSWNGASGDGAAEPAGPLGQVGAGLRSAAQPLRQGLENAGDRVRAAAENLGERTDRVLDQLDRPLQPGGLLRPGPEAPLATVPPPATEVPTTWNGAAGSTAPAGAGAAPAWNGGDSGADSSWNGNTPSGAGAAPGAPGSGPMAPPLAGADAAANADPWANSADPRLRTPNLTAGTGAGGNGPAGTTPTPGNGPTATGAAGAGWPGAGSETTWPGSAGNTPGFPGATGPGTGPDLGPAGGSTAAGPVTGPPVHLGMFDLPADRPLEGPATSAGTTPGMFSTTGAGPASSGLPTATAAGAATSPGSQGWGQGWGTPPGQQPAAPVATTPQTPQPPAADGSRQKAVVVFAWVLLFTSAASNVYLFWSYLDVRTKYRALVRKTARAVGSRLSAA
ncbi:MAG TPA: hypothetical protein VEQ85_13180 [Lacipirellulaceae bacterium]|nr:hypothetical protein [Lacipirellulaceae bacterium]